MASGSMRYTIRQSWPLSGTRSSWHRRPIDGIGRECGKLRLSPCCSLPSRYPASILASSEKGGVLIWPCSQTRGYSLGTIGQTRYVKYDISTRGGYAEAARGLGGVDRGADVDSELPLQDSTWITGSRGAQLTRRSPATCSTERELVSPAAGVQFVGRHLLLVLGRTHVSFHFTSRGQSARK